MTAIRFFRWRYVFEGQPRIVPVNGDSPSLVRLLIDKNSSAAS
jgi:hypothetical protein